MPPQSPQLLQQLLAQSNQEHIWSYPSGVLFWSATGIFLIAQAVHLVSTLALRHRSSNTTAGAAAMPAPAPIPAPARETTEAVTALSLAHDYLRLTKPRVLSLLLLTTLVAMVLASDAPLSPSLVFWTLLGGYLAAGGAGAINCAFDHDIDRQMERTSKRPVPAGRISHHRAFGFGLVLVGLSFVVLYAFATLAAAVLAMLGVVYYSVVYTRWLKRSTWHNVVIGGGAGALPPLVGWAAVTGSLTVPALLLSVIIFYWTPIHFWTLALLKKEEYSRACLPMLPVVVGEQATRWQILLYSLMLVALSLLLPASGVTGPFYLPPTILAGSLLLTYAWNVYRNTSRHIAWQFYSYSLVYLALLFCSMVLGHMLQTG